ncbi:MAG: DegT/DnrJ/EryC1/StrS family aminotransferase [Pirellulales bacterium]|nr:DegT/DnrJ/EryC1/StrS family aminotransferase [Pirellulales bacterium]
MTIAPPLRYPLSDIDYDEQEVEAVAEVVRGKWLSLGPRTAEFEETLAEFLGAKHAVAVSNCTAALHLAMLACGLGPGDEVLVPSYTFVATANAITYVGATPVFVDITGPGDLNLDPGDVEAKITPRTRAIVPVHLAGFPAAMDRIMAIARRHHLAVIEDACHAIGTRYAGSGGKSFPGRMAGTIGDAGCFSFFANKSLATGEGGMLVTDDDAIAARVRLARSHGMSKSSWDKASGRATDYDIEQVGYNYRCTELTAALGLVQLGKLPASTRRRKSLVARYRQRLGGAGGLAVPFLDRIDDSSHYIFPVLVADASRRNEFRQRLLARGIQTSVHYPPVHCFTHYRQACPDTPLLERTVDAASREVTLPLHPLLDETDIDAICDGVLNELGEM